MKVNSIFSSILFSISNIFFLSIDGQVSIEQKPMIIIVPSYNNQAYYQKNLDSIVAQHYNNYRVIYIDDCSTDCTGTLVEQYIKEKQVDNKIQLIKNTKRRGALANMYYAVHSCPNNTIIVTLDGDDWFAHDEVLVKLNKIYSNPRVWMTYGSYIHFPDHGGKGCCSSIPLEVIETNAFREYQWVSSLLRTFYAGLFKKIAYDDLRYNNTFFPMAWDLAFMFPMLEMCGSRFAYIPDILYVYNVSNPINDSKVNEKLQLHLDHVIRQKKKYTKLADNVLYPWDVDSNNAMKQ